ncbi:MAG: hypothetical protein WCV81_00915 [Microgenomates group bacterium]
MPKKVKTQTQDWKILTIKALGIFYLVYFILSHTLTLIPLSIYEFLMAGLIISPFSVITNVVVILIYPVFVFIIKEVSPNIVSNTTGLTAITIEIIFIVGLFKRWRFSWAILVFTMILGLLKNYGLTDPWGLIVWEGSFNPSYNGWVNIYTLITIASLYILYKIRGYYK